MLVKGGTGHQRPMRSFRSVCRGLTLISTLISNHIPSKVWDEITYDGCYFSSMLVLKLVHVIKSDPIAFTITSLLTLGKRNALLVIVSPKNDPNAFLVIQNNAFSVIVFENRHLRRISIGTNVVTREVFGKIIVCIEWPRMLWILGYAHSIVLFRLKDALAIRVRCVSTQWMPALQNDPLFLHGLSFFPIFGWWVFPGTCLSVVVIIYTSKMF